MKFLFSKIILKVRFHISFFDEETFFLISGSSAINFLGIKYFVSVFPYTFICINIRDLVQEKCTSSFAFSAAFRRSQLSYLPVKFAKCLFRNIQKQ